MTFPFALYFPPKISSEPIYYLGKFSKVHFSYLPDFSQSLELPLHKVASNIYFSKEILCGSLAELTKDIWISPFFLNYSY